MKVAIKKIMSVMIRYSYDRVPIVGADGFDIIEIMKLKAAMDTADYCLQFLPAARIFSSSLQLLTYALERATLDGSVLEFGVASGTTINHIAERVQHKVHGFDSFRGLPEDWRTDFEKGRFAQKIPNVLDNVELHVGLFDETLPKFRASHEEQIAFLHIDCDLYSSTKSIFENIGDLLAVGSVIVFDEYFNHPTWRQDEWKAFQEFVKEGGVQYEYLGYVPRHQQVAVLIRKV